MGILLSEQSEIDFMIRGIFTYDFFGHEVWITTTHVSVLILLLLMIGFCIVVNRVIRKKKEIPSGLQNVSELLVEKLDGMVDTGMSKRAPTFYNYIGTLFLFILLSNFSGLLGLRPPTADYGVTLPLALITFTIIHVVQFRHQRLRDIWKSMCSPLPPWLPIWFPIGLISEIAVPISMSLRLFANILSGVSIMALIYGMLGGLAVIWPAALHIYFDLFSGAIQTYVFCLLTMTYVSNSYADEE
ncbi:MAG: F0F1 ATP synthase subunit A [Lachnospiraceae bacterium]|jgi:F-type H+-transporting ATPase subunit a|nr:F0F1 ATP synthase subunit A [Lachnospiraceae bacterium]